MGTDLEIDEVNELIRAVEARLESVLLDLEKLDEFKDAHAHRALQAQIRSLEDQRRLLAKRWSELTKGFGFTAKP